MRFTNANIFRADGTFRRGGFSVENGCFAELFDEPRTRADTDLGGLCVIPGVIDIHTHGISGRSFSPDTELAPMLSAYAKCGVTSVLPTSMTVPAEELERMYAAAAEYAAHPAAGCARLTGLTMEGPFFSYNRRGAQDPGCLLAPDTELVRRLHGSSGGLLRIVCVAPELPGAMDFIGEVSRFCRVSIAHTDCSYEQAEEAFARGANQLTHLFNAMPSIHHRNAGPIAAGSENCEVYAELICDGMHVSPAAVRMAFKLFPGRVCIISDSLGCAGLPDGEYTSGGMKVILRDGLARLEDGTIAGSICDAFQGMRNCVSFGIPREEAILSATIRPARQAGCADRLGSIESGKLADFVVCTEALELKEVYIGGQRVG